MSGSYVTAFSMALEQSLQSRGINGKHFLYGADILQRMETKSRFYGERAGLRFGEPLLHKGPLPDFDPQLSS
jgi:hypothetical protein